MYDAIFNSECRGLLRCYFNKYLNAVPVNPIFTIKYLNKSLVLCGTLWGKFREELHQLYKLLGISQVLGHFQIPQSSLNG